MESINIPPIPPRVNSTQWFSVKFSISRWDLIRCRLWVVAHNRFVVWLTLVMSGVPSFITAFTANLTINTLAFRIFYAVFMMVTLICLMALFQVTAQALLVMISPNRGVVGAHEIELRDDGLLEKSSVNESLHRWAGFHKFGSSRNFFFVYVTDTVVHYVPRKIFPSEPAANRFRDEIQKRANDAKATSAS
jgi:hypothetical protein